MTPMNAGRRLVFGLKAAAIVAGVWLLMPASAQAQDCEIPEDCPPPPDPNAVPLPLLAAGAPSLIALGGGYALLRRKRRRD